MININDILELVTKDLLSLGYKFTITKELKDTGQKKVYFISINGVEYALKIINVLKLFEAECIDDLDDNELEQFIKCTNHFVIRASNEIQMSKQCSNLPQLKLLDNYRKVLIDVDKNIYTIYYIEEKINGTTFRYKPNYEYTISEIIDFIQQMLDQISIMSSNGYIHRDIKPSNIILNNGKYHLIDGGLCKNVLNDEYNLTVVGQMLGTHRYCAPEQINIRPNIIWTFQTDLYPVGLIATEMFIKSARLLTDKDLSDLQIINHLWKEKSHNEIELNVFKHLIVRFLQPIKAMRGNNLQDIQNTLIKLRKDVV